eukprot:229897-Chlamydomonas_euryale.AAC.15
MDLATKVWTQLHTRRAGDATQADPGDAPPDAGAAAPAPTAAAEEALCLPPLAGHSITVWKDALILLGGHAKPKDAPPAMPARVLDAAGNVAELALGGPLCPSARGGHSATLIGRRVYVFGGEDAHRRALGDLWVLDLDDMAWAKPDTTGRPPAPRSAHVAAAHGGRYLLLFGGGSVATCFSDVHVLDTAAKPMQWSQPFVAGPTATPRAGHCGAVIGATWYVVGGGNNVHGVSDMLALDLRGLTAGAPLEWRVVASVDTRDPLSSEGAALVALPPDGGGDGSPTLLSFGGYNGKYHNTLSMMAAVEELPQLPAAAARAGEPAKGVALPATSMLHNEQPPPGAATAPTAQGAAKGAPASASGKATSVEEAVVEAATDMKSKLEAALKATEDAVRDAAAAKESASRELLALRGQLGEAITKAERAGKERDEAKAALTREREKAMKLEVEIAELRKKLGDAGELQKEVEALRRCASCRPMHRRTPPRRCFAGERFCRGRAQGRADCMLPQIPGECSACVANHPCVFVCLAQGCEGGGDQEEQCWSMGLHQWPMTVKQQLRCKLHREMSTSV